MQLHALRNNENNRFVFHFSLQGDGHGSGSEYEYEYGTYEATNTIIFNETSITYRHKVSNLRLKIKISEDRIVLLLFEAKSVIAREKIFLYVQ